MGKFIMLAVVAVVLAGCSGNKTIVRTGTICVNPFSTVGFQTSNPVEIKQDVVDNIRNNITPQIKHHIAGDTELKVRENCNEVDYKLTGSVVTVNTSVMGNSGRNFFFGGNWQHSHRSFGVGLLTRLIDNKTGTIISEFEKYEYKDNLVETVDELSGQIADEIKEYSISNLKKP